MNILFLNPVGVLGGAELSLLDMLEEIRRLRPSWQLHLITGSDGPLLEKARKIQVRSSVVAMPQSLTGLGDSGLAKSARGRWLRLFSQVGRTAIAFAALPYYLKRLRRAVATCQPSLIHSNGIKSHLFAGRVAYRNIPVIWHVRDFLSLRPVVGKVLRRFASPPALVIANSEAVRQDTAKVLPTTPVISILNGIDTERFSPEGPRADLDQLAGLPPARVVRIGLVATYARWKGQDVLIEAAARLLQNGAVPPVRFYIIGGPVYETAGSQFTEAELRERVRSHQLDSQVGFVPFQQELGSIYRALDVVVHASVKPEPFGRTIVEAMACGKAVVVAAAGGAAEIIEPDTDAVAVAPGDVAGLAMALAGLVADEARRKHLGQAARTKAVERFSRRRLGREIVSIYDSLLKSETTHNIS